MIGKNTNTTTYTIQYGSDWFNDYLVYTEYTNEKGNVCSFTLVDQDGKTVNDKNIIESVFEYIDNLVSE